MTPLERAILGLLVMLWLAGGMAAGWWLGGRLVHHASVEIRGHE
jgi:hypothetical protein